MLAPEDIERRLPLWVALSDLFLDTEMGRLWYPSIVKAIRNGGFTVAEAKQILIEEVGPVFAPNLLSVAGEWAGFPDDFVRDRVSAYLNRAGWRPRRQLVTGRMIDTVVKECWPEVERAFSQDSAPDRPNLNGS
jgi:hypothetical protein